MITSEYGSQMLSLGGVDHLTGGSKQGDNGDTLMRLCNREAVELAIDDGATITVQAERSTYRQWRCRETNARRLWLGDDWHVCISMERASR